MSEKIEVEVAVTGADAAATDIDAVEGKVKDLGTGFGMLTKLADKFTGGMASGMVNAYKSTKVFIKGLNLTKAAMISTGIGALVVAVGILSVSLAKAGGETSAWNRELVKGSASWKAFGNNIATISVAWTKLILLDPAGAWEHLTNNLVSSNKEVHKAVSLWEQYHANLKEVIRLQRELVLDTASASLEQYKLNQQINDGSLSMEGRISAMKDLTIEEYALIDAKEQALKLEIETIELAYITGNLEDGDLDRKIAATAALTRLMVERYKVNDKYKKGVNTLRTQEADHAREQADRAITAANEVRDAEIAKKEAIFAANKARIEGVENTLDAAENLLHSAQERELKALDEQENKVLQAAMDSIAHLRSAARQGSEEEIDAAIRYADDLEKALDDKRVEINKKYADAAQAKIDEDKALQDERNQVVTDYLMSAEELELAAFDKKAIALREANILAGEDANALDEQLRLERLAIMQNYDQAEIETAEATAQAVRAARLGVVAAGFDALKVMAKTEEGQKKLAIAQILVNQGIAMSSAIRAGLAAAANMPQPAGLFAAPGFVAAALGIALSSFASIKGVMNQAGAALPEMGGVDTGGGVGGGGGSTQLALTPTLDSFGAGTLELPAVQAFIIQNDIADAATLQAELQAQASL